MILGFVILGLGLGSGILGFVILGLGLGSVILGFGILGLGLGSGILGFGILGLGLGFENLRFGILGLGLGFGNLGLGPGLAQPRLALGWAWSGLGWLRFAFAPILNLYQAFEICYGNCFAHFVQKAMKTKRITA